MTNLLERLSSNSPQRPLHHVSHAQTRLETTAFIEAARADRARWRALPQILPTTARSLHEI
jgi:hypothetical protein